MSASDPSPAAPEGVPVQGDVDVLVVGGGINGCGIARDLAGRGLRVLLCEQDDLASHTSSSSTKLIHGGLRYLEYGEFGLVRKALLEREVLLKSAPHIMWPLRFVMPHDPGMRPAWMIRAGLFLYDHLAPREVLPGSTTVDLRRHPTGEPLQPRFRRGFVYSDGWVDDARLVVLNAIDAESRGATVLTRTRCVRAERGPRVWRARLRDEAGGECMLRALALVNAAGPWAGRFLREEAGLAHPKALRLVKGSHIVVPRRFEHDHAYIFQNPDKRIIFAIPYEGAFTLIGTTDVEIDGDPGAARIDAAETDYLCTQASRYFARPVRPADVVWSYAGVRPLLEDEASDAAAVTRDYLLELDTHPPAGDDATAGAPLLSVWGGKITTFRRLAEEAADLLCRPGGALARAAGRHWRGAWTHGATLPGGDLTSWVGPARHPAQDFARFELALRRRHPFLGPMLAHRLARAYGQRVEMMFEGRAAGVAGLGAEVAPGLYEAELAYLRRHEYARRPDDVLWRRSKLGLHYDEAGRERLRRWWHEHPLPAGKASAPATEATWN